MVSLFLFSLGLRITQILVGTIGGVKKKKNWTGDFLCTRREGVLMSKVADFISFQPI